MDPPLPIVSCHPFAQIHRQEDELGRLVRIELRTTDGKTIRIRATFDWEARTGERRAVGAGISSGYSYYGGAEHFHTAWDDGGPNAGKPMPFEEWVNEIVLELETRANVKPTGASG